ncbi:MAG TPA: hypothetical protein VFR11_06385 [Micromonosporaceae bacterium]|nr:hypothetical protein [Micromonosporaceae bacterium]
MNPNQPQYPASGGRAGRNLTFAMSDVIVAGAAVLFFIFSFTPIVSVDVPKITGFDINVPGAHVNLWNFEKPLGWWTAVANLLLLATAVLAMWWPRDREYAGFRRSHAQVAIALFVFIEIAGSLFGIGSSALGWGGILMLLLAIVALAAAILGHLGMLQSPVTLPGGSPAQSGGYTPPAPGGYQPPAGGYAPPPQQGQQHQGDSVS